MQRVYKYDFKNIFQYETVKYKFAFSVGLAMQMNKVCSVNVITFFKQSHNIFAILVIVF